MPLYTKEEIRARIEALDAKIAKAEEAQAYTSGGPGDGMHHQRGDLRAMYAERQYWLREYERLEALEQGGAVNLVRFRRPR
ncbi:MAG: hypothetical protein JRI59_08945 [Deltaproteobacteria bacterium]|nr:hypothetical protein [Deltaproteobacteria bacterium]